MEKKLRVRKLKRSVISPIKYSSVFKFRAPNCKFSKAERFAPRRLSVGGEFNALPSTVGIGRRASFGFGKRIEFKNPGGAASPPCNTYNILSCFDKITGGLASPIKGLNNFRKSLTLQRDSPCSGFSRYSANKARNSMDLSINMISVERNLTPGPRRLSLS